MTDQLKPISEFVTYGMVTRSDIAKRLGIDNEVATDHIPAVYHTAKMYDEICKGFGAHPNINCFYRSALLNQNTPGSSKTSQHCKGEAMDLDMDLVPVKLNNSDLFHFIKDKMSFDQIIWEGDSHGESKPDWVHVSFRLDGKNRKQCLRMKKVNGVSTYTPF